MSQDLTPRTLEIAHVLFMDVVSYSLLPIDHQSEVICELQEIVRSIPEFQHSLASHELICLPTGDGMALAFSGDPSLPLRCARQIALALKQNTRFSLRMGLHTGPVYRVADINANRNIAGGGINYAQRVMDCGDAGHILVSKAAAEILLQLSTWNAAIHDLGEVEVKHGVVIHLFNVFTEEFGNPRAPSKMRPDSRNFQGAEPNLGRLVIKMCDRRSQEEEFRDAFLEACEQYRGSPQLYVIPGEEGQCHESLVERLIHRVSLSVGNPDSGDGAAGRIKKIPWQYEGELPQRTTRLIYSLFENLGLSSSRPARHTDLSPSAFSDLMGRSMNAWVAVQHEVHAARWDSLTPSLMANYVRFWSDMPQCVNRPPVVVFVSLVFRRASASSWNKFVPVASFASNLRKKHIWNHLQALQARSGVPCRILTELPAITREDVLEWFSLNCIYQSEEKRIRAVDRLFPGGSLPGKAMWEIERFCAEELQKYALERGYDERWQGRNSIRGSWNPDLKTQPSTAVI